MNPARCSVALSRVRVPVILFLVTCCICISLPARAASLTDALDNPTLTWRTSALTPWVAQSVETHDGIDAAQSGLITHGEESWLETTVTGPTPLSFWWKVSSELGYDQFQFLIDGIEQ